MSPASKSQPKAESKPASIAAKLGGKMEEIVSAWDKGQKEAGEALAAAWDELPADRRMALWRNFCTAAAVTGISTHYKGEPIDADVMHPEYRGEAFDGDIATQMKTLLAEMNRLAAIEAKEAGK